MCCNVFFFGVDSYVCRNVLGMGVDLEEWGWFFISEVFECGNLIVVINVI